VALRVGPPSPASGGRRRSAGSASIEHLALAALVAGLVAAAVAAVIAGPPPESARELGAALARRLACAPRHPIPCNRNPLALAYGFPLGKLVRHLAPAPRTALAPGGLPLVPVDFRYCRRASCALPRAGDPGLTTALRRATAFTSVADGRRSGGPVEVTYWLYRPTLGWERLIRRAGAAEIEAASAIRLRVDDDPALVPLETLPGRNHYEFPLSEEPPWRWKVASREPP
jgi:hypothetical protein